MSSPLVKDASNSVAANRLSGVAAKGVFGGARVIVFDALTPPEDVSEDDASLLGEGVTNSDGSYSLTLQTTEETSDYLVAGIFVEDASMVCDAPSGCLNGVSFGERVTVGEGGEALWAIFPKPEPGEAATANINLFTHFQLFRMLGFAYDEQIENDEADEPITLQAKHFAPAFEYVSNAFGLQTDAFHTVPYVDPTQPIGASNREAIKMGLLSAGFLEAEIQSEIYQNGEEALLNDVFSDAAYPFLLPNLLFQLNENDENNNPRVTSLEDMFEAALKTAELNTANTNSLSLTIALLTERNELIDSLMYDARLKEDGTYPDERRVIEDPEPDPDPDPDPEIEEDNGSSSGKSCRPNLSPGATDEIVLLSGYEGTAYSSVDVSAMDRITEVTRLRIEPGETPLYIVASTYTNMVWSLEGETDRVSGFVAAKGLVPNSKVGGAGVVGLTQDRVDFIDYDCMEYFTNTSSKEARSAQSKYENIFERDIDHVLSDYTLSSVAIPSGDMIDRAARAEIEAAAIAAGQTQITADNGITFNIESETEFADQTQLFRFTQEGLATVPVKQVISPEPVETYDVVPAHAGLVQLLSSGHIEYLGRDNSYLYSYFIHETFSRFPPGLTGAHSVKFILGTGVEMPGGDIGHSRVYSESGECLKGQC